MGGCERVREWCVCHKWMKGQLTSGGPQASGRDGNGQSGEHGDVLHLRSKRTWGEGCGWEVGEWGGVGDTMEAMMPRNITHRCGETRCRQH
jgi:hypothetical protein